MNKELIASLASMSFIINSIFDHCDSSVDENGVATNDYVDCKPIFVLRYSNRKTKIVNQFLYVCISYFYSNFFNVSSFK